MNIKVSVALAVYNPNYAFLKKQLVSILNQTVIPNKIVILDDCSKEPKKIRSLITSILNGKIEFIFSRNNINFGYSKTFKKISRYIDGEIIFFSGLIIFYLILQSFVFNCMIRYNNDQINLF